MRLRPTHESDIEFVLRLESDPENSPFVGSWSRAQHLSAITAQDQGHWIIETDPEGVPAGYIIALDLQGEGLGVHVKRMVVSEKGRGIGRAALSQFLQHAFHERDAAFVWLDVLANNFRAQAAYRATGFQVRSLSKAERAKWARAVGGFEAESLIMVCDAPPERSMS